MKTAVIFLAPGFEEVEALTPADYLRRAGASVTLCSIGKGLLVEGAHGIRVEADATLSTLPAEIDCLVFPGGMPGTANLAANAACVELARRQAASGRTLGAICAAPALVLGKAAGLLAGKRFTCYPGMEDEVKDGRHESAPVVRDGNIITSRGAGTAGDFAVALVEALFGAQAAQKLAKAVLLAAT